jgi:DNA-binding MarR family transcriptional regulator
MLVGLGARLRRLITSLDGDVQAVYDELGVDFRPRFFPVVQLLMRGDAMVGAIAAGISVSQPAATQTLQEMRKAGLVEISRGRDARSRRVALTGQGQRIAERLAPVWAAIGRAADALDAELPNSLSGTVDQALAALERIPFRARISKELGA